MKMSFNPIVFASNLARAYEIARCGGHSIQVVLGENQDEQSLTKRDLEYILEYFNLQQTGDADMFVELTKPDARSILLSLSASSRHETIADINQRIDAFLLQGEGEPFSNVLSKNCQQLMETAITRLDFDLSDTEKALHVAQTIARMSGASALAAEHVAEAIQYRSLPVDQRRIFLQTTQL